MHGLAAHPVEGGHAIGAQERADIKGHEAGLVAIEMANLMLAIDDEVAADDDDAS